MSLDSRMPGAALSHAQSPPMPEERPLNAMAPVRLGLVGSGRRLRKLLAQLFHVLTAHERTRLKVVGLVDPDPEARQATRALVQAWQPEPLPDYPSPEALCAQADPTWVWVGSWNSLHAVHAERVLQAGKSVFLEKPPALDLPSALRLQEGLTQACSSGPVALALGLPLRFSPHYQRVAELVLAGRLGRLVSLTLTEALPWTHGQYMLSSWRSDPAKVGSLLLEKSFHELDLIAWLANSPITQAVRLEGRGIFPPLEGPRLTGAEDVLRPSQQEAASPTAQVPDHLGALLKTESGVLAVLQLVLGSALPERRLVAQGTHGSLRADYVTGEITLGLLSGPPSRLDTGLEPGGDVAMLRALWRAMRGLEPFPIGLEPGLLAMQAAHLARVLPPEG